MMPKHQQNQKQQMPWFSGYGDTGFLGTDGPGRTDNIPMSVQSDSYVIPADIVSGMGQGNSNNGRQILDAVAKHYAGNQLDKLISPAEKAAPVALESAKAAAPIALEGAASSAAPIGLAGAGEAITGALPAAEIAAPIAEAATGAAAGEGLLAGAGSFLSELLPFLLLKDGGKAEAKKDKVDIIAAGGEYVFSPDVVKKIGGGDVKKGHELLDKMVVNLRKKFVKKMQSLPGPAK